MRDRRRRLRSEGEENQSAAKKVIKGSSLPWNQYTWTTFDLYIPEVLATENVLQWLAGSSSTDQCGNLSLLSARKALPLVALNAFSNPSQLVLR